MQTSDIQGWRRLHPTMLALGFIRSLRGNLVGLLFGGYFALARQSYFLLGLMLIGTFTTLAFLVLRYFSYRYRTEPGHLAIREGIVSRKLRNIPVQRIHNINTRQSLLGRFFQVVQLDIETAGGGEAEASFPALKRNEADRIKAFVQMEKSAGAGPVEAVLDDATEPTPSKAHTLYQITWRDLFLAGATASRLGLILVGLFALFEYLDQFDSLDISEWAQSASQIINRFENQSTLVLVLSIIALIVFFLALGWLISISTAAIRWYGFTLQERGEDLAIRSGLFTVREYTIPRPKVQALQFEISLIRRLFRLLQIKVQSAGRVGMEEGASNANLLVPIASQSRTGYFVKAVFASAGWDEAQWHPVHPYTRWRHFLILTYIQIAICVGAYFIPKPFAIVFWVYPLVLTVLMVLAWLIAHYSYRQTAYAYDRDFIYIKSGFLALHYWVIPANRVQCLSISQSPYQRFRGLVSLTIDLAGTSFLDTATIPNIPLGEAWRLFNRWAHPALRKVDTRESLPAEG